MDVVKWPLPGTRFWIIGVEIHPLSLAGEGIFLLGEDNI